MTSTTLALNPNRQTAREAEENMWDADKKENIVELKPRAPFMLILYYLYFYVLLSSSGIDGRRVQMTLNSCAMTWIHVHPRL